MHLEPVESPYVAAKKTAYKLIRGVWHTIILLKSAWYMKSYHFQRDTGSDYKKIGWWVPLIPESLYAWAAQHLFAAAIAEKMPKVFLEIFPFGNVVFVMCMIYSATSVNFGFHVFMCWLGRAFGIREAPPPFEFFLVREAGAFTWFAVAVCLFALPVIAQEPGIIGWFAALMFSVPLVFAGLMLIATFSQMRAGSTGRVGLKEMYRSDRFVTLFWRVECSLMLASVVVLIVLARHPEYITNLIIPRP